MANMPMQVAREAAGDRRRRFLTASRGLFVLLPHDIVEQVWGGDRPFLWRHGIGLGSRAGGILVSWSRTRALVAMRRRQRRRVHSPGLHLRMQVHRHGAEE